MKRRLRIAIAEPSAQTRDFLARSVLSLGHDVTSATPSGSQLVQQCLDGHADLIIASINLSELDGIAAVERICQSRPTPVILLTDKGDEQSLERAADTEVWACLVKPIKPADLEPAIAIVLRRFEIMQALFCEVADMRQALEA